MRVKQSDKCLGSGGVGSVYQGFDMDTMRALAVKEVHVGKPESGYGSSETNVTSLPMSSTPSPDSISAKTSEEDKTVTAHEKDVSGRIKAEIDLMKKINHPNIVQYYGSAIEEEGRVVKIFMELMPGGSVGELVRTHGSIPEATARSFVRDVLQGLHYLHHIARVCHRDIKPDNVLLTLDGQCKLSDFGVSKHVGGGDSLMNTCVGTSFYMAPEVVNNEGYSFPSDMWSVGCLVIEILTGEPPFGHLNPIAVMYQVGSCGAVPTLPPETVRTVSPNCIDFVGRLLEREPKNRPTATEMLRHPWIKEIESERFLGNVDTITMMSNPNVLMGMVGAGGDGPLDAAGMGGGGEGSRPLTAAEFELSARSPNASMVGGSMLGDGMMGGGIGNSSIAFLAAKAAASAAAEKEAKEKSATKREADTDFFPGFQEEEKDDSEMLPHCDRCTTATALFSCDSCKKIGFASRLCPACWREVHQHHRSNFHRKLPLLLPQSGQSPESSPAPPANRPISSSPGIGSASAQVLHVGGGSSPQSAEIPQHYLKQQAQRPTSPLSTASPIYLASLKEPPPALGTRKDVARRLGNGGSPLGSPKHQNQATQRQLSSRSSTRMSPRSLQPTPRAPGGVPMNISTSSGAGAMSTHSASIPVGGGDGGFYCAETAEFVDIFPREKCVWECGKCRTLNDPAVEQCTMCDHPQ